jgi:glycosyltransferase involved in cell wall biosynthesis
MPIDYSIIIPAYNEENYLQATLAALQEAMPQLGLSGEIIVVDNNSSDRTAEIAATRGAKVIFEAINQISRARNTGARAAAGRYLIFVDADTLVPRALLQQALADLESGKIIGGGAGVTGDIPLHYSLQLLLKLWNVISIYTRYAAGSFIYCRRDAFETTGGFSEAVYASEEIWLSRNLKKLGRKRKQTFCIIKQPPVITSMRKMQWYSPLRIYLHVLLLAVFPFMVRIKSLCTLWYRRPS